jgi:hypothetical protein
MRIKWNKASVPLGALLTHERHQKSLLFLSSDTGSKLSIHTYHSRFIPEGVAEVSQIFLRDTHVLPKLVSNEEHCRRDRW